MPPRRLPLHPWHESLGASFVEHYGWLLPRAFRNPAEEHLAVRRSVGVMDLSHYGKFAVKGRDRVEFLHGLVTNDVKSLKAGSGLYATMLNHTGRILAELRIYAHEEHLLAIAPAECAEQARERMAKSIVSEDVSVEDLAGELALFGVYGPNAARLLSGALGASRLPEEEFSHTAFGLESVTIHVAASSFAGEGGYEVLSPVRVCQHLWSALVEGAADLGGLPVGFEAMTSLRVEGGVPACGYELDETVIPLEAGLEKAIHYNKGCYVGQEVIARVKRLKLWRKVLVGFTVEGETPPARGAKVFTENREVGYITSAAFSPLLGKIIALGFLHVDSAKPGVKVTISAGGVSVGGEVSPLPFYGGKTGD